MKKLFFLAALVFMTSSQIALAEITNPYTVDEKSQVLFGDSWAIITANSTYQGLENYTHDYVNHYLHITFTYARNGGVNFGCGLSASYPPRLYITLTDPRATTTPGKKANDIVYHPHLQQDCTINWYLYDIQFNNAGYRWKVLRSGTEEILNLNITTPGLTNTDWAALANDYLLPPSEHSMSFTPVPITQTPPEPEPTLATTTPVIIVPGIMATELLEDKIIDDLIWPNTIQIVSSISDDFLDVLKMNELGNAINEKIKPGEVIKTLNNADYFDGLLKELSLSNFDLLENSYDWRLDIESSASKLEEKIEEIKTEKGVSEVNIIAHSMGGLLVKKYLKDYGGSSVDKFIDIGTPHTGAPSAYKILMYGDNLGVSKFLGLVNINSEKIKEISQNMPSVYQLLPSQKYFDDYGYYVFNAASGSDRLTFTQTSDYLKVSGRNSTLVDRANVFHREIDGLDPEDYGVETYNFVGCGTPTVGQFYILQEGDHPIYNIRMINGDGTVPLKSAEAISVPTFYVKNVQHALMPSTSGVKELVAEILNSTSTTFDISPYSNLATTALGCEIPDGKIVSFHSPIELHVYNDSSDHTGPDSNGDIENEIEGVIYEIIGDNKFAYLPDGSNYEIIGIPISTGTFDVRIGEITNGEVTSLSYWNQLPVSQTSFIIGEETPTTILNVPASAVLSEDQAQDLTKPVTELQIKGNKINQNDYISSVQFTLFSTDDNAGVLKTEYSLDDGQTWIIYSKLVVINKRGGVKLMYRSIDKAGNMELVKSKIINIIWPGNSGKKK